MTRPATLGPTPERMRHDRIMPIETMTAGVVAHQVVSPDALDGYHVRQQLDPLSRASNARRYLAGCVLREAWADSGLAPVLTGGLDPGVDHGHDPDARIVAGIDGCREYRRLMQMVPAECRGWLHICACEGRSVGRGEPMMLLRVGLNSLAKRLRL